MSEKISNLEKALVYMFSCDESKTATALASYRKWVSKIKNNGEMLSDVDFLFMPVNEEAAKHSRSEAKINNRLVIDRFSKFVEKDKYYSDIEPWFLPVLQKACAQIYAIFDLDIILKMCLDYSKSSKDYKLQIEKLLPLNGIDEKRLAEQNAKNEELNPEDEEKQKLTYRINKYFGGGKLKLVTKDLVNNINKECKHRLTMSREATISTGGSVDDTVIDLRHQKKIHKDFLKDLEGTITEEVKKAKDLEKLEELYLFYTTTRGCDLTNAFLRGDLSLVNVDPDKSKKLKASWNTDLTVDPETFLDIMSKALKLKKNLMSSEIPEDMTVYRGVGFDKLLSSVGNNNSKNVDVIKSCIEKLGDKDSKLTSQDFSGNNIVYQSKGITSTSTDKMIAQGNAQRSKKSITLDNGKQFTCQLIMKINVKKGTAFGKDFEDTTFGNDDYNSEVILAPDQKIKINSASIEGKYIVLDCETIPSNVSF